MKKAPPLLDLARQRLNQLFDHPTIYYGQALAGHDRCQAIRSDFKAAILAVLGTCLNAASLQHDGAIVRLAHAGHARLLTVAEIAKATPDPSGRASCMPMRRCERVLQALRMAGLINCSAQKITANGPSYLVVSATVKIFTTRFWNLLGLGEFYRKAVAWAKEHAHKIRLILRSYVKPRKNPHKDTLASPQLQAGLTPQQAIEAQRCLLRSMGKCTSPGCHAHDYCQAQRTKYSFLSAS